jgi:hypothetical protein
LKLPVSTRRNGCIKIQMFVSSGTKKCAKHVKLSNCIPLKLLDTFEGLI